MSINAPKGTHDVLPFESYKWQYIESIARDICELFGYKEIRIPVFEHTELFQRGVGDATDVVQKEMYTFLDKGNRSITLRPEGTSGVVRSFLENNLSALAQPVKVFYQISCYRYERPQAGRFREFNQFGVEAFSGSEPSIDAEIISLAMLFLKKLGVGGLKLYINSIGCKECRKKYNSVLKEYLDENLALLCETCRERYGKNPMRILDCKSQACQTIVENAPKMAEMLCEDCGLHFQKTKQYLSGMKIAHEVDHSLVRGLDYYTRTVFEIKSDDLGAQSTVCGGGRYDGLVEELGGKPTPGIGFSLGMERLISIMEKQGIGFAKETACDIFIVSMGEKAKDFACEISYALRSKGVFADLDHTGRSVKAQMKYADKIGANFCVVLGEDEINSGCAQLKNMVTKEIKEVTLEQLLTEGGNLFV